MLLQETRKEDDFYFSGCFWVIANSYKDILKGNFKLLSYKYLVNFKGDEVDSTTKSSKTHRKVWDKYAEEYNNVDFTYYPRGRVNVYNGGVFINIHSKINLPKVINAVIDEYNLNNFNQAEINVMNEDEEHQNGHYDFQLK